ncbi:PIN/TRAM domain-containing protein [Periweissella beninensis]|uniref:PIN/TRAM domain-containing protein n=1 Tax=Periweissella beninensis TaxID=504936 RepID=A0ABT0VGC3_9LACO|nr:PIN/TRAM domain-containing protein [Periweissella beninensis]MCM2436873.1 PIN/TRAM domain-containing protein [Periweissella beninensis]MCT4395869.1 PIN/TRAM domain-containing protein [Periweissella beninensis]
MIMMRKRIIQAAFALIGGSIGLLILPSLWNLIGWQDNRILANNIMDFIIGAILFFIISFIFVTYIDQKLTEAEKYLAKKNPITLLIGSVTTILGLLIAVLISSLLVNSDVFLINTVIPVLLMLVLGYLGFRLGTTRIDEWKKLIPALNRTRAKIESIDDGRILGERNSEANYHHYKILDTNILIDGRIYDLVKTGFLEGTLLVPNFVLYEIQYIADSADSVKRVRGRRGLDILNKLREEQIIPIEMYEGDYEDIKEVDEKLIQLAKDLNAVLVTNDYNLNKVTSFQNVEIFNINELVGALKPRVLPGEELHVMVVKKGTERQQGVAYLDDGTMVVVEDGQFFMNKKLEVTVTSAIQTDAGRMIFAKPVHSGRPIDKPQN